MAGFTTGEGCFAAYIERAPTAALKYTVRLYFIITQHTRDETLIRSFKEYFQCGNIVTSKNAISFRVTNLSEIKDIIVPFFKNSSILGEKYKNYSNFCKIVDLKLSKAHLTEEGLNEIFLIVNNMNTRRI